MRTGFTQMNLYMWIILAIILLPQSYLLFKDAGKRGANKWFWGIWGLFQFPCPTIFYLIIVRKVFTKKK